jgi:2-methylcitrate dehydratase PrpD
MLSASVNRPNGETAAQRMATFAKSLQWSDIPKDVQLLARLHMADAIGVALAASSVPSHRHFLISLAAQFPAPGAAVVIGMDYEVETSVAALMNGTSMHSLEYDDTHMQSIVHGSAVIVATVLALAQEQKLSLTQALCLTVVGWECLVRLGIVAEGAFQRRGFQVTSVGGTVVAAILAATARGADTDTIARAAGISGSQSGGIFEFLSDGSNVKALHPGWAAHSGVWAASLAMSGMTGPMSVLEGKHGIYAAYADEPTTGLRLHTELDSLGQTWVLRDAAFKFYPCCHYIHPYLEVAAQLRVQAEALERRIVSAKVKVAPGAGLVIAEPWEMKQHPRSPNDAKYSLPYCVAMVLLGETVDVPAMTQGPLNAVAIDFASRISMQTWSESGFPIRFAADMSVTLDDGQVLQGSVHQVQGSAERPPTVTQVREKFLSNARCALPMTEAEEIWDAYIYGDTLRR